MGNWREFQIWSIGVVIIIGGNFIMWNQALAAGFLGFVVITILVSTGFACLVLCISEILSGLPFSGGAFCMARCTLGLFPGFLTGFNEVCYYVISTSFCFTSLATMISDILLLNVGFKPIIWFLLYALSFSIQINKKTLTFFWGFTQFLAVLSILLLLLYSIGSLSTISGNASRAIESNISEHSALTDINFAAAVASFQSITWFFTGIECLSFVCNMISTPKSVIARSFLITLGTVFAVTFLVIIVTLKLNKDYESLSTEAFPLNQGFISFLGCTTMQATFLSIPGTFATGYGFMFAYSKLLNSLALSGLLPEVLSHTTEATSPCNAAICGSLASFGACAVIEFVPILTMPLSNMCFLAAYITYCVYCLSYVKLKQKFGTSISYAFESPIGLFGAFYGIAVFALGILSVCVFQQDKFIAVLLLVLLWIVSALYYLAVSKNRQKFSKEEQKAIFLLKVTINPLGKVPKLGALQRRKNRKGRLVFRAHTIHVAEKKDITNVSCKFEPTSLKDSSCVQILYVREKLQNKTTALELREQAAKAYCEESVDFCMDVIAYRQAVENILTQGLLYSNLTSMHSSFSQIVVKYIKEKSPFEVNISSQQRTDILKFVTFETYSSIHPLKIATIFDKAFAEIEKVLAENIATRH